MPNKSGQIVSEQMLVAVNVNAGDVLIEVGFKPEEKNAKFAADRIRAANNIIHPVHIKTLSDHRIDILAPTPHFWFYVNVTAEIDTSFTVKLSAWTNSSGWFELRGTRYEAGPGKSVSQTFNARLGGFKAVGAKRLTKRA